MKNVAKLTICHPVAGDTKLVTIGDLRAVEGFDLNRFFDYQFEVASKRHVKELKTLYVEFFDQAGLVASESYKFSSEKGANHG